MPMHEELYESFLEVILTVFAYRLQPEEAEEVAEKLVQVVRKTIDEELRW